MSSPDFVSRNEAIAIHELIDAAISEGAVGPDEIAEKVVPNLPAEVIEPIIFIGVRAKAHERLAALRKRARTPSRPRSEAKPAVSRFARVKDAWDDPMQWQVVTADGWKCLGDCTAQDIAHIRDRYSRSAEENLHHAERYAALHDAMRTQSASVVRDLDMSVVEETLRP